MAKPSHRSSSKRPHYDLLVIGAGIHGAGVAQAAAAAGYSVLVLEQGEVASGTSSRSSKLIHGGLRYLEHGQFSLVRECLRERALLLKLAPSLVQLRPFYIPVYADSSRNRFVIRAGLTLYSLLGGMSPATRFHSVPKHEWASLDGLKTDKLCAVFQYWDAQTDDAQLTRAVMASAQGLGAELQQHAQFCSAKRITEEKGEAQANEQWEIYYRCDDAMLEANVEPEKSCTAGVMVNAAGPWVNKVLEKVATAVAPVDINWVQGTHLVLEGEVACGIYYLESPRDKRPVFVMPWQVTTSSGSNSAILLGTTETRFQGDPASVRPLAEEQDYLLEVYRHYFSSKAKVLDAFAGLRVLPMTGEEAAYASHPRETVLQADREDPPGLVSIYGGKLTTYRATSQKVLKMLRVRLPKHRSVADTSRLNLE